MFDLTEDEDNVYTLLSKNGWTHEPGFDGYANQDKKLFISNRAILYIPGEVRYFLKTGFVRNIHIFDSTFFQPTPKDLGFKTHKDGRCVKMERIK